MNVEQCSCCCFPCGCFCSCFYKALMLVFMNVHLHFPVFSLYPGRDTACVIIVCEGLNTVGNVLG